MNYLINILLTSLLVFSSQLFALDEQKEATSQKKNSSIYEKISSTLSDTVWGAPIDTTGFPEAKAGDDRAGYRSEVSSVSQKFYNDVKEKLSRGEKLNFSERVTVNFFIATRRWPDAPKIDAGDKFAQEWVEKHFSSNRDFIAAELASCMQSFRGRNDNDSYMSPDSDLEKFRQYYHNIAPEKRSTLMNTMMSWYRSQGYDMRNDAAKKASKENDKIVLDKRKDKIKAILTKHQKQLKKDNISDTTRLFHCLCRSSGGSMGGYYSPGKGGPCLADGVLSSWQAGMSSSKKIILSCLNQIDYDNYQKSLKIFEEMHRENKDIERQRKEFERKYQLQLEAKYPKFLQKIQKENAESVQEQLQEVKQLIQKDETLEKGVQLFLSIKPLLYSKDEQVIQKIVQPRLSAKANKNTEEGNLKNTIKNLKLKDKVSGFPDNSWRDIKQAEYWLKSWAEAKKEIFPKIQGYLQTNQLEEVKKILRDKLHWQMHSHFGSQNNHYPPAFKDKDYLALMESYNKKINTRQKDIEDTFSKSQKYLESSDPKAGIKLLNTLLHKWQHTKYDAKRILKRRANPFAANVVNAKIADGQGDIYKGRKELNSAIRSYSQSVRIQKDTKVQRKLDDLLKRHKTAIALQKDGDTQLKKQKLSKAVSQYERSVKYWPNSNLRNLINRLKQQLEQEKRKAELKAKIAKLEREKARQEEEQMTNAGLDFGNRFSSKESRRSEKVQDRQMRDAYTDNTARKNNQEEMLERLKQNLEKIKAVKPVHVKPVANAPLPQELSHPSSIPSNTTSKQSTASPAATSQPNQVKTKPIATETSTLSKVNITAKLIGTWKGKSSCCTSSGTFKMDLFNKGEVFIVTKGDMDTMFNGTINKSGAIKVAFITPENEKFRLNGKVTKNASGNYTGKGTWSDDEYRGTWKVTSGQDTTQATKTVSKPKKPVKKPSKNTSISTTGWDGLYIGSYTDKHLNTRDERCQNHSGKISLIIKGNRFSGDGSGTIAKKGSGSNAYLNGSFNNGYKANGSYIVFNNTITGIISGPPYCTAGIDLRKR